MICISDGASTSGTKNEEQLQQSQNYLPAYLKKVEDEADEPTKTIEKLVEVVLEERKQKKTVWVGAMLFEAECSEVVTFLRGNMDVFTWSYKNMPRIALQHVVHSLKINLAFPPIHQKQIRFTPERNNAINDEVDRLLEIGAIEESFYPVWLCNPVVVPKKNEKLRICMDFTHLNKACPKDSYHLPRID